MQIYALKSKNSIGQCLIFANLWDIMLKIIEFYCFICNLGKFMINYAKNQRILLVYAYLMQIYAWKLKNPIG